MSVLLAAVFLGLAANVDNLGVGFAYGLSRIRIPEWANLLIAVIGAVFTVLPLWLGRWLAMVAPGPARLAGGLALIGIGVWVATGAGNWRPRRAPPRRTGWAGALPAVLADPVAADLDGSGDVSLPEALLLGVALSVNCAVGGLSAGLVGLPAWLVVLSVSGFSCLCIDVGQSTVRFLPAARASRAAPVLAGLVLSIIGIHQLR